MGTFELFRSTANQNYYFRFKSGGTQFLSSEGYGSKTGCSNGIESVKKNASSDNRYDRKDGDNHYTFNLKAANGEIIARSTKVYKTKKEREDAIVVVKRDAPGGSTVDLS